MMRVTACKEDSVQTGSLQQAQAALQVTGDFVHPRIKRPLSWTQHKMASAVSMVPMSRADVCESLMKWPHASLCASMAIHIKTKTWKHELPSTGDVLSLAQSPPASPYCSWILATDSAPRSSMSERSSCSEQLKSTSWLASPCRPCLEARSELLAMVLSPRIWQRPSQKKQTDSEVSLSGWGGLMGTHRLCGTTGNIRYWRSTFNCEKNVKQLWSRLYLFINLLIKRNAVMLSKFDWTKPQVKQTKQNGGKEKWY